MQLGLLVPIHGKMQNVPNHQLGMSHIDEEQQIRQQTTTAGCYTGGMQKKTKMQITNMCANRKEHILLNPTTFNQWIGLGEMESH